MQRNKKKKSDFELRNVFIRYNLVYFTSSCLRLVKSLVLPEISAKLKRILRIFVNRVCLSYGP